jgi:hypothetical protein
LSTEVVELAGIVLPQRPRGPAAAEVLVARRLSLSPSSSAVGGRWLLEEALHSHQKRRVSEATGKPRPG